VGSGEWGEETAGNGGGFLVRVGIEGCLLFMPRIFSFLAGRWGWVMVLALGLGLRAEGWEKEDFVLGPEVEAAWVKQLDEARPLHVTKRMERLGREVARLQEAYGLTEKESPVLTAAVPGLAEAAVPLWEQSMRRLFRLYLVGDADRAIAKLTGEYGPEWLAAFPAPYQVETVNSKPWADLVRGVLSGEAYAAWEKARDEEVTRRGEETRALVAAGVEKMEPEKKARAAFEMLLVEMVDAAKDAEWVKPMRDKIEVWAKQYAKACEERSMRWLDACHLTGSTWPAARKRGYYCSLIPTEEWTGKHEAELMGLMPEAALAARAGMLKEREAWSKRVVVSARVMIVEVMAPLDPGQLKAVEAAAGELPMEVGDGLLNPGADPEPWRIWKEAEGARRLNAILDDRQERMVAKAVARFERGNQRASPAQENEPVVLRHPALGPSELEEVEEVISESLAESSREHAVRAMEPLMRDVDAVVRVLGLDEAARGALELAAKGTVQMAAEAYRVNQGRWMRSQTQGATPEGIRQRLKNLGGYSFQIWREGATLVEETLGEWTDEAQREVVARYQDEVKRRRDEAISLVALARLQKALGLTRAQRERLGEALVGVMATYGPDIETNFRSWGERMPWFLQSYYLMLPGAGVGEEVLKALLNERQREVWDEAVTERGGHYWSQILEYHDARVRGEGGKKEKRRLFFEQ
jgi:hypothetical protein